MNEDREGKVTIEEETEEITQVIEEEPEETHTMMRTMMIDGGEMKARTEDGTERNGGHQVIKEDTTRNEKP